MQHTVAIVLGVLGVLSLVYGLCVLSLNSGTLFFAVWLVLGGCLLALAWLVGSGTWFGFPAAVRHTAEALCALAACAVLVAGCFAASGMSEHGEDDLDYIVVLGAQVRSDGSPSGVLQHRLDAAADYLARNPRTRCIVTGGKGFNEPVAEAKAMSAYLVARGIDPTRVIEEPRATDTVENITFSMEFLDPVNDRVGIVTNGFHVFRSVRIAQRAGIEHVCGVAAWSDPFFIPNNLLRESLSIILDFAQGKM